MTASPLPLQPAPAAAAARTTVLITGFGPFPGVPVNATMRLVPELAQAAARRFAGVRIATAVLATEWAAAPRRLDQLLAEIAPDLVLHFGVSSRARGLRGRGPRPQCLHAIARCRGRPAARAPPSATAGPRSWPRACRCSIS